MTYLIDSNVVLLTSYNNASNNTYISSTIGCANFGPDRPLLFISLFLLYIIHFVGSIIVGWKQDNCLSDKSYPIRT